MSAAVAFARRRRSIGAVLVALVAVGTVGTVVARGDRPTAGSETHPRAGRVEVLGEQVTRSAPAPVATTPPSSTTTTSTTTSPPVAVAVTTARSAVSTTCGDALAYLAAHQAPGFTDVCADGSAFGHLGVTCVNQPGMCAGTQYVHIACPAPFVYMNEAHNSWVLLGRRTGIDPYGQGTDAERAVCSSHR